MKQIQRTFEKIAGLQRARRVQRAMDKLMKKRGWVWPQDAASVAGKEPQTEKLLTALENTRGKYLKRLYNWSGVDNDVLGAVRLHKGMKIPGLHEMDDTYKLHAKLSRKPTV